MNKAYLALPFLLWMAGPGGPEAFERRRADGRWMDRSGVRL